MVGANILLGSFHNFMRRPSRNNPVLAWLVSGQARAVKAIELRCACPRERVMYGAALYPLPAQQARRFVGKFCHGCQGERAEIMHWV